MVTIGSRDRMAEKSTLVALLQRGEPLRTMPIWARYLITIGIVLVCFEIRWLLDDILPYPFLIFLPAVVVASFIFNRGSGFLATFLSGALALYFFTEPRGSFAVDSVGAGLATALFVIVGALIATVIEALRVTAEDLTVANQQLERRRGDLRDSHNRLETIIESVPDPIYLKDREGRYVLANAAAVRLLGVPQAAILGRRDRDLMPSDQAERVEGVDRLVVETLSPLSCEEERAGPGPDVRWYNTTRSPWFGADGNPVGIIGIVRDVHERRIAENELRSANDQKALLLEDLSHRVKNHLQSLIALLSLSQRRSIDPASGQLLQATIGRIMVLARVYDRLQIRDQQGTFVGAHDYLRTLVEEIAGAIVGLRPVTIETVLADVEIDANRAVTIGLIVNEALTNALKYAFPGDRAGTVAVRLEARGDRLVLSVSDDGVGLPDELPTGSTGQWLMQAMARQLGGSIETIGSQGTTVVVEFPA